MKIEIDEKIITETTQCKKKFECLSIDSNVYCKVEKCLVNKDLLVECSVRKYCIYKTPFEDSFMCSCPTRNEIFNKYGI